jgi:DNA-binding response OmpR family regulator
MVMKPPVILFAERELSWSRGARVRLRRRGAHVTMASSAEAALWQGAKHPPVLLILDEDLEDSERRDPVELFREAFPEAEIILLESEAPVFMRGAGQGLFFSGSKPIAPDMLIGLAESALQGRLADAPGDGASPKQGTILCVDDDPQYLKSVSRFLGRHGYRVSTVGTADQALDALPKVRPDLALVDIMMPGMDGFDLSQRIRENTQGKVPVVFLTALDPEACSSEGRRRGGRYTLCKSEKPQRVLDVVDYLAGDLDESERELIKL